MSDCGEYTIILYEDDIPQIKEIFEISLNIIFFHRYLGNNDYEDVQSKLNKISYVKLKNEKLTKDINNIINQIQQNFENNNLYGQIFSLNFYEKDKKNYKNPWEKWNFIVILSKNEEKGNENEENERDDKESKIRDFIFNIIEKLNDKDNFMPNVKIDEKHLNEESFLSDFKIENISTKENYLSIFNNYMKKNKENVIVLNQLP